jgi:hypothetical protein
MKEHFMHTGWLGIRSFIKINKMEKTAIIIIAIITSILVLSVISSIWMRSLSKTKRLNKRFLQKGEQNNLHFSEMEIWGEYGIGVDRDLKCIFYANGKELDELAEKIEFNKIQQSEVRRYSRMVGKMEVIDRIELKLILKDKNEISPLLEIFDIKSGYQIDGENLIAQKWSTIINECLNNK